MTQSTAKTTSAIPVSRNPITVSESVIRTTQSSAVSRMSTTESIEGLLRLSPASCLGGCPRVPLPFDVFYRNLVEPAPNRCSRGGLRLDTEASRDVAHLAFELAGDGNPHHCFHGWSTQGLLARKVPL